MELPVDSWYPAVFIRVSRRSFNSGKPVEGRKAARLAETAASFRPFSDARVEFVGEPPDEVLRGVVGGYGKISGAPLYLAMVGLADSPGVEEHVGYTGEGLVLEATALGLGSCWVSGFFRPAAVRKRLDLSSREKVYAVSPVGYAAEAYSSKDRLYRTIAGSKKRRPLSDLVSGEPPAEWQWKAIEAGRLAPSAANRQPWRFEIEPRAVTVRIAGERDDGKFSKRLDCGIAMLHLELGARAAGVEGRWTPLLPPSVARFEIQISR